MKTFALILLAALGAQAQSIVFSPLAGNAGSTAQFSQPGGVAVDASGNVYVADSGNDVIRKITPSGMVTTLAGLTGVSGSADGVGSNALFSQPAGVAVDGAGNLYVADFGNSTIRRVTPAGAVSTLAGASGRSGNVDATGANALFNQPEGVAVDSSTNVYVADYGNNTIRKITAAGAVTTFAGTANSFYQPGGIAVDSGGNVYVADTANNTIRKITAAGAVTTVAGTTNSFGSLDGLGANALFYQPSGLAVDSATNLYVADYVNNTIRRITPSGLVSTLAGLPGNYGSADGPAGSARFWGPLGIAVDSGTNVYVTDSGNNTIRKISPSASVSTFAGSSSAGDVDGLGPAALFNEPQSVAADPNGNVYVADSQNNAVRKISAAGLVSTVAPFFGPQGLALDNSGNLFVADTGNNRIQKITAGGAVSTVAGPANFFNHPQGIAVDGAGNLYVADSWNNTVRQITPGGVVTTLAGAQGTAGSADGNAATALFNQPSGVAVDGAENIYVTDFNNHTIREITAGGTVITLAGMAGIWGNADGINTNARFNGPLGIALDSSGNLYVADSGNRAVRKLSPSGTNWSVSTVAADAAPTGLAINTAGTFYLSDSVNNTIFFNGALGPFILTQPQSQTNVQGATVTFSVVASGTAPLNYMWQYNGDSIAVGVSSVSASQAGSYSVTVLNSAGSALSAVATLTLTNPLPGSFQAVAVLPDGSVQLSMTGSAGATYAVQATTNLIDWTTLITLTNTGFNFQYNDPGAANFPERFYRLYP